MSSVIKGNFETKKPVRADEHNDDITDRFERTALQRLGGSIAFVSKKKFIFDAEPKKPAPNQHGG